MCIMTLYRMSIAIKQRSLFALAFIFLAWEVNSAEGASLVSTCAPGFQFKLGGNGDSGLSILSKDGRYILFASTAGNLALTNNNNSVLPCRFNVFLRDGLSNTTTLVSVNQSGAGGGNGDSFPAGISTNGQYALFESSASDLVPNDTNSANDVFVRDVIHGTTTLVSISTNGASANGGSLASVMTPDGRYVVFQSAASNLVAGDTNNIPDVFIRDLQAGTTTLVSAGAQSANSATFASASESPEVTPDGRYVAFYSTATNLVAGVSTLGDVYVRDLVGGNTVWASTNARAIYQAVSGNTNVVCCNYSISDDGQFVAFEACTNAPTGPYSLGMILRFGLAAGTTDILSTNAPAPLLSFELIHDLCMTPDGRFVAFVGNVPNGSGTNTAIYLWDAQTGTNSLVSASWNNPGPANGFCDSPVISSNGQFVAFTSTGTTLVTNALAGGCHVYLRDVQAGATELLDADTNGVGVGVDSSLVPALSADGSTVAFDCANLLQDNRHRVHDVFSCNDSVGALDLASAANAAFVCLTPDGNSGITSFSSSSNGQFVAFYSDAENLVSNDTNGCRDVFVRDLVAGTNILVSVNTNGECSGDGISTDPAISGDGRYVVFSSSSDDLVTGDTNRAQDVFIRDLQAGTTTLVSVSTDGIDPGNGDSFSPSLSSDGRYVLFHSKASNLASGSFGSGVENLFLRDLQGGTTYALTSGGVNFVSATPDCRWIAFMGVAPGVSGTKLYVWSSQSMALAYTNNESFPAALFPIAISANGQKLAYLGNYPVPLLVVDLVANTLSTVNPGGTFGSHAGFSFSSDGRFLTYAVAASATTNQNVYLYDFDTGSNLLISQSFNPPGAPVANSDSPSISPNGRYVAYRSFATNIVPLDFNNVADLFLYDASDNSTLLVSVNGAGSSAADDRSLKPVFSSDGQTLFFQSWASDITGGDFNNGSDIFALDLTALPLTTATGGGSTNSAPSACYARIVPAGVLSPNPAVGWSLAAGESYQVQYKANLSDPVWLTLPGNVTYVGASGFLSDLAPAPGQRFYRVVLSH